MSESEIIAGRELSEVKAGRCPCGDNGLVFITDDIDIYGTPVSLNTPMRCEFCNRKITLRWKLEDAIDG